LHPKEQIKIELGRDIRNLMQEVPAAQWTPVIDGDIQFRHLVDTSGEEMRADERH
jgi:hypothetical protein